MDGLEAVEMKYSILMNEENFTGRIDAEYQKKEFLNGLKLLKRIGASELIQNERCKVFGGKRLPKEEDFSDTGIKYARAEDIKGNFLDIKGSPYISVALHLKLKKYVTNYNDVLLTIVGNSIGDVAINRYKQEVINMTENCAKICNVKDGNAAVIFAFFKSKYGQLQISREKVGTAQPKLSLERIRKFIMPKFGAELSEIVESVVEKAYEADELAKRLYVEADNMIISELGFIDFTPNRDSIAIKSINESFGTTGRIDAEFYQPKYEEYQEQLATKDTVDSVCNRYDKNFVPDINKVYRYIELADVGTFGNIERAEKMVGADLPSRARRKVKAGQIIVSSIEGSLQSCALVTDEYDGALCSTGFYVLDSDIINSETLLVLFKSDVMQNLMRQRCSGTILTAISKDELKNIPFPKINEEVQMKIADKIHKSFAFRRQAQKFLNYAKEAVEIAIEKDENTACKWIKENLSS